MGNSGFAWFLLWFGYFGVWWGLYLFSGFDFLCGACLAYFGGFYLGCLFSVGLMCCANFGFGLLGCLGLVIFVLWVLGLTCDCWVWSFGPWVGFAEAYYFVILGVLSPDNLG